MSVYFTFGSSVNNLIYSIQLFYNTNFFRPCLVVGWEPKHRAEHHMAMVTLYPQRFDKGGIF